MGLELYMIGVIVAEMPRALEFYRRLGVDIPEGSEEKAFVGVKMGEMTFFLSTMQYNARWDPARQEITGTGYRTILEFYLKTKEQVEAKYAEMIGYGYASHLAPYMVSPTMCFAMINDPDGNTILLSWEVGEDA